MPFSTFPREDFPSGDVVLVARRQCWLLEEDLTYANMQLISFRGVFGLKGWVAIQEGFGAYLFYAFVEYSAWYEDAIERFYVWLNGGSKHRISRLILWRLLEELLASGSIKLDRPLRVGFGP
jgi:hypothetical protein